MFFYILCFHFQNERITLYLSFDAKDSFESNYGWSKTCSHGVTTSIDNGAKESRVLDFLVSIQIKISNRQVTISCSHRSVKMRHVYNLHFFFKIAYAYTLKVVLDAQPFNQIGYLIFRPSLRNCKNIICFTLGLQL